MQQQFPQSLITSFSSSLWRMATRGTKLLKDSAAQRLRVVEVDSQTAYHIFQLASHFGEKNHFVGIEQAKTAFDYVVNCREHLSANVLFATGHLQYISNDTTKPAVTIDTITNIVSQANFGSTCPTLIKLSDVSSLLLHNSNILMKCKPLLYLSNDFSTPSRDVIELLTSEGYAVFWHVSTVVRSETIRAFPISASELDSLVVIGIVGVPIATAHDFYVRMSSDHTGDYLLFPFRPGMFLLEEYDIYFAYQEEVLHTTELYEVDGQYSGNDFVAVSWFSIVSGSWTQEISSTGNFKVRRIRQRDGDGGLTPTEMSLPIFARGCPHISIPTSFSVAFDLATYLDTPVPPLQPFPVPFSVRTDGYTSMGDAAQRSSEIDIFPTYTLRFPPHLTAASATAYADYYCVGMIEMSTLSSLLEQQQLDDGLSACVIYLSEMYAELMTTGRCSGGGDPLPEPFDIQYDPLICTDPLWCNHTLEFQRRLEIWQNPSGSMNSGTEHQRRGCSGAKYLLFEPSTEKNGIGSMLAQIAVMMRFAICNDRILYLTPRRFIRNPKTHNRWMHSLCEDSLFECFFRPLTSCRPSDDEMADAYVLANGHEIEEYPYRDMKTLAMFQMSWTGKCTVCGSPWDGSTAFFDGTTVRGRSLFDHHRSETESRLEFRKFMGIQKMPWMAQMARYILRPRRWFSEYLKEAVRGRIAPSPSSFPPHPFASMHVRYGEKAIEVSPVPLKQYMHILSTKAPHIRHVFVSTETVDVIRNLTRDYPQYSFHYLQQTRHEAIHTVKSIDHVDFFQDFVLSMANLYVSIQADFFVGTLSSSWCAAINYMERTRGDAGHDYHSVDRGSSYPVCF
eukprot:CAMPEP_0185038096 /NCGR_PEP_ID=MMETSP1103-20130426/33322_1 /TAXON_ID=36769 /ORGANISM="Paraphysomonas bandaiensis, Strain Caron Lab Isolate" /LENGTH=844 /DNA_ID=CAMNT_0027576369 /DNA_START=241 /DNA_END=2776 /DNA_ORIENTATION=+